MLVTVLPLFTVREDLPPEYLIGLAAVPAPIQSGDLMLHPGVNVTLHCSLASDISSHTMSWYRQHVYGEPVQFIVNEYDRRQGRFQATLETEQNRFLLEIAELQPDDSGTYYCAAYHSEGGGLSQRTHNNSELRYQQGPPGRYRLAVITDVKVDGRDCVVLIEVQIVNCQAAWFDKWKNAM
ncbi:hypothetical protein NHX12_020149 [Muraenolepis orangiensis]|uniref:Ig-like domain-containing protein n=1 Tax=Muraenolepis orangiensis TaxID=630683 RepID=A0A9Q0EY37_9TELE|nr:hypothetical protein NHX12_020149 [Muraenolepis orangiensis]